MKLCCIFNYNPLYRYPIYKKMADVFGCDFFFGDTVFQPIKGFDKSSLPGYIDTIYAKKLNLGGFIKYSNTKRIFRKEYTHFIIVGEPRYLVNWQVLLYAKLTGKKVMMWTHGVLNEAFIAKKSTRFLYSLFFRLSDIILQYGEHPTPIMLDLGCKIERIKYIHNSLDTALLHSIYESLSPSPIYRNHFKNNNPTVIYIGRIQKRKRVDLLVLAVEELRKHGMYVNIVIVGGKTDDEDLEQLIEDNNHDGHIWMYGPCYEEERNAELLYNASLCVCPSQVGLTAIHSLSYGTPVVSNDNFGAQMPEYESITPNVTGSFFKEDDINDLAKHIYSWVSIPREKREAIREIAVKSIADAWSVNYQIEILKSLL